MNPEPQQQGDNIMAGFATPPLPATPSEFISAMAHFHRAEIARNAPYTTPVRRLDEAGAAKRPIVRQQPTP